MIDFYQVLNQVIEEAKSTRLIENVNEVLSAVNEVQIEIASLCNSNKILNWLKIYLPKESFQQLFGEVENLNENDEESKKILDSIIHQLQSKGVNDLKIQDVEKKVNNSDISIKHKLKLTIPLFLFTQYEAEIELSDKQKLPKSVKELKKMLIE